jgi:hypothetical protein
MTDANRMLLAQLNILERLSGLAETKRTSTRKARLKIERLKARLRRIERATRRSDPVGRT